MKRKIGKFSLKKQTISNLSVRELNGLKGGTQESESGCTYCPDCFTDSQIICKQPSAYANCQTTTP